MSGSGDYIRRADAIEALYKDAEAHPDHTFWTTQHEALRSIPAADVRPVVLCKDCKYYYKDADGYEMCDNSEGYDHVTEDGFCAWAVKREES